MCCVCVVSEALWALVFTLVLAQQATENSPLGDLLRGSVDVSSCQIGEYVCVFLFPDTQSASDQMIETLTHTHSHLHSHTTPSHRHHHTHTHTHTLSHATHSHLTLGVCQQFLSTVAKRVNGRHMLTCSVSHSCVGTANGL